MCGEVYGHNLCNGDIIQMTELCNAVVRNGKIPKDWSRRLVVNVYKGKGDALACGSVRGIKLVEHAMKRSEESTWWISRHHCDALHVHKSVSDADGFAEQLRDVVTEELLDEVAPMRTSRRCPSKPITKFPSPAAKTAKQKRALPRTHVEVRASESSLPGEGLHVNPID